MKLRIFCLVLRSPHSLDLIHSFQSLFSVSEQESFDLFIPGFLLTILLTCPSQSVYFVTKFLPLKIGATSYSIAILRRTFYVYYLVCII